ncbi:hypothetical protein FRC07_012231 [Ceratobasidium sp. 392]|nr:hypothetical protein FRC07_012231 [Ceratobasidium sp. 392]
MPPLSVPLGPRRGAAALMSQISKSASLPTPSSLSDLGISAHQKRCFYCPKVLPNDSARFRHIADTPECRAAQQAALLKAVEKQEAERQRQQPTPAGRDEAARRNPSGTSDTSGEPPSPGKRRKVTVETVPDEDDPVSTRQSPPPPAPSDDETSVETDTDSAPGPSRRTQTPVRGRNRVARCRLRRHKGLFIEEFPDPFAGAPISKDHAPPPDLKAHMKSCGSLANPDNFEVAELLMTSGLTDQAKDRHLKSKKYQGQTPWCHVGAMLTDVDKLKHGPPFELCEIDIFDGRRPRAQFMVV